MAAKRPDQEVVARSGDQAEVLERAREAAHQAVAGTDVLLKNLRPFMRRLASGKVTYEGRLCGYCYGPLEVDKYPPVGQFAEEMVRKGYAPALRQAVAAGRVCPWCFSSVEEWGTTDRVPDEVLQIYQKGWVSRWGCWTAAVFLFVGMGVQSLAVASGWLNDVQSWVLFLGIAGVGLFIAAVVELLSGARGALEEEWYQYTLRRQKGPPERKI